MFKLWPQNSVLKDMSHMFPEECGCQVSMYFLVPGIGSFNRYIDIVLKTFNLECLWFVHLTFMD